MDGTAHLFGRFIAAAPVSCIPVAYPANQSRYDDLEEWVRQHVPHEPFGIIAESFSGPLAIRLAANPLLNLRRLVLVATFAKSPQPSWLSSFVHPALFARPLPRPAIRALLVGASTEDPLVDDVQSAIASVPAETLAARLREVLRVDVRAELAQVSVPTGYLRAARDRVVSRAAWTTIQQRRPDIRQITLDGPHLVLQRRPDEAWRAIEALVKGE